MFIHYFIVFKLVMHFRIWIYLIFLFCFWSNDLNAQRTQNHERRLIQFSGVVVSGDSLDPVPYANIIIRGSSKGAVSNYYGFFSFVAEPGDIIEFSAFGYKPAFYTIPDTMKKNRYSWIQVLNGDTMYLTQAVIVPWPTLEQFKRAFVETKIPNDDMQRAQKNLALAEMKERYMNMPMDGSMNYKNFMDNQISKNYYKGQFMPNNLLNPFAWAQFIKAWKDGKFKRNNNK